jgi:hypothetical protein
VILSKAKVEELLEFVLASKGVGEAMMHDILVDFQRLIDIVEDRPNPALEKLARISEDTAYQVTRVLKDRQEQKEQNPSSVGVKGVSVEELHESLIEGFKEVLDRLERQAAPPKWYTMTAESNGSGFTYTVNTVEKG